MNDGDVTTEVRTEVTDGVAVLTVSNPARRNALNLDLSQKLVAAVEAANADDSVGAIVVTGQAPAFCAGGDLAELQEMAESEGADTVRIEKKTMKSGREIWTLHGDG